MISIRDLEFRYAAAGFRLRVPRLDVRAGERLAVVGVSGSGKTTLLELIAGIRRPRRGTVEVDGEAVSDRSESRRRRFRIAQFELPRADGDEAPSELIVFHFGKGQGGGVQANLDRWKGQFQDLEKEAKVEKIKASGMEITVLDMTGTYLFRPAPMVPKATPFKGRRMLGAIVPIPKDGPYFFRMVGPKKSITAQVESFRKMVSSAQPL